MDTWIDKAMVIRKSFMQDIENNQWNWRGSVLFLTDVTVLRIVSDHMFFFVFVCFCFFLEGVVIYVEKQLNECVDTFSVMQLWVLLTISGSKCLMHFRPISVLVGYL